MSECLEAPQPAAPCNPSTEARAARLAKFERERLIVEYLNRGVSVCEIAARVGVSEKRMRAVIREILARRMPAPPAEYVAIQVSRLNEALLVAYSAMTGMNLKAVDRVVKIVRELDRYHGFTVGAERRPPETSGVETPAEGALAFGTALFCRAEFSPQDPEKIDSAPEIALVPEATNPGDATREPDLGIESPGESGQKQATLDDGPDFSSQALEKIESAPGIGIARGSSDRVDDTGREPGCLFARPTKISLQRPDKIESASERGWPAETASASAASPTLPNPIGARRMNFRAILNGVAACPFSLG